MHVWLTQQYYLLANTEKTTPVIQIYIVLHWVIPFAILHILCQPFGISRNNGYYHYGYTNCVFPSTGCCHDGRRNKCTLRRYSY